MLIKYTILLHNPHFIYVILLITIYQTLPYLRLINIILNHFITANILKIKNNN